MSSRLESEAFWQGIATALVQCKCASNDAITMLYTLSASHRGEKTAFLNELDRLIRDICADGVVTTKERGQLLRFLQKYVDVLSPAEKGAAFEAYVIRCFNNRDFRLIEWRSDKYLQDWGGPLSSEWPDLVMEHTPSGRRFAIECKYRKAARNGMISWARRKQLDNYAQYEKREGLPVYVALGIGGSPASPRTLHLVRLHHIMARAVHVSYLERYAIEGYVAELDLDND